MQLFIRPFSADSSRAVFCYWRKEVHLVLACRLGLSLPRKSVGKFPGRLDMTIFVDWDVKQQTHNGKIHILKMFSDRL